MIPRLGPAPAAEVEAIHEASLPVLAEGRWTFPDAGAQALLADAGAAVDAETGLVRIPPPLVEEALAAAPRDVPRERPPEGARPAPGPAALQTDLARAPSPALARVDA